MTENKPKCPYCGGTEDLIEIERLTTFNGQIITYKCLNSNEKFRWE